MKKEQDWGRDRYGSVSGIPDSELGSAHEWERMVLAQEFEPILRLPRPERSSFRPDTSEDFGVNWGAFGTVDFDRISPSFDKARYKAQKLREELRDVLLLIDIVSERLPKAKYLILKYLRQGIIGLEHVKSWDMVQLAELHKRARRLESADRQLRRSQAGRAGKGDLRLRGSVEGTHRGLLGWNLAALAAVLLGR